MPVLKLAVFDCDGTLVDSQHSIVSAMSYMFDHHGLPSFDADATRRMIGLPLEVAIAGLLGEPQTPVHDEYAETYRRIFRQMRGAGDVDEPMFEGAIDMVRRLDSEGWLLGIATGKARRGVDAGLGPLDILKYFQTIQTADVALGKPHPDMLHRAMSETGADAGATVMIGDTTFDMQMAGNAGVAAIGVSWGYHERDALFDAGADVVIERWEHLPGALTTVLESA